MSMLVLSRRDAIKLGLSYVGLEYKPKQSWTYNQLHFQQQYGSSPTVLVNIWYDLQKEDLPESVHEDCPEK
eukprot:9136022-Ditylum_brightwellii.AAC.2